MRPLNQKGMPPQERRIANPPIREVEDLASATECTGLTPSAVRTGGEAESYARLYAIHPSKPVEEREP